MKVVRMSYGKAVGVLVLGMLVGASTVLAQGRFEVPLTVTDGVDSYTLYFGIVPASHFCVIESDSMNGHAEFFLPPVPPGGVFDTRFVWPRTGSNLPCFDQGTSFDYRPFTALTQKDTFKVKSQLGTGATMVVSWPSGLSRRFTGLNIRFIGSGGAVNTDMLTDTTVDISDAGDPAVATIYSAGLVVGVNPISPVVPGEFALTQNYPNPFNPATTIPFAIARTARTEIAVYNILGQKVATLANELMTPGYYKVQWNGTNTSGAAVASGVYFVRMSSQADKGVSFSALRKLVLMR